MVSPSVSQRFVSIRFPLIVGVVFIHAYATTITLQGGSVSVEHVSFLDTFIRNLISKAAAQVAVPLFFLLSGYLFFQGYDGSWRVYRQKIARRIDTLVIPFLIWNAATLALYAIGEAIPKTQVYFATRYWPPIRSFSALDYGNALLGLTTKYPMSYQFWFIRDLICMVLAAPLIYLLCKRKVIAFPLLLIFLGVWFWGGWPLVWPADLTLFFFFLGAVLSMQQIDICALDRYALPIGVLSAVLVISVAWTGDYRYLLKLMIIVVIPFVWWLTRIVSGNTRLQNALAKLAGASFFVYAAHEPLLSVVRKFAFKLLQPQNSFASLALYLGVPVAVIVFLVLLSRVLVRAAPRLMAVVAGSRGA